MESERANAAPDESLAFELLTAGNPSAAVATITGNVDARAALEGFAKLCNRAYHDLKSVPTMTGIAWEAVGFGNRCASTAPDSESAMHYKARVRAIAYNAAANCWPGWGDPIEINSSDIAEGLKLAERSLALVEEISLGDKAIGSALWLVGALQMAAGQLSVATAQFLRAEKAFHAARLPAQEAMAQGYVALADKISRQSDPGGAESLAAIIQSLRGLESREGQFFADQLVTADRIFSSR